MQDETHAYVFEKAWELFNLKSNLKLDKREIIKALHKADYPRYKVIWHWHHYQTGKGLWFFKNAKEKGVGFFYKSLRLYRMGRFRRSSYYLGLAIHYLCDMSIPAHVKGMLHAFDCDDQENFLERNYLGLRFSRPVSIVRSTVSDFYDGLIKIASRMDVEKTSIWIGIKYLFGVRKKERLDKDTLFKQGKKIMFNSTSYVLGLLDYFGRKV